MSWAELPLEVIEKIICCAVKGDKKRNEPYENWYAMRVYKYGCVHSTWTEAIRVSRNIFQSNLNDAKTDSQQIVVSFYGFGSAAPPPFIKNCCLQAVKKLKLYFGGYSRQEVELQFIADSIAARNSIRTFHLVVKTPQLPETTKCQIIELLTRLRKMNKLVISVKVGSQAQAEWLWHVTCIAIHTTSRPKTIHFDYKDTGISIDWSFINRDERLEVGSIERLTTTCNVRPAMSIGFFDKLADIDVLVVQLQEIWRPENSCVVEIKAKHLQILCELSPKDSLALYDKLRNDDVRRVFRVETVECFILEKSNPYLIYESS